jgi:hypothetical protein
VLEKALSEKFSSFVSMMGLFGFKKIEVNGYVQVMELISLFNSLHEFISVHVKLNGCPIVQFSKLKLQVAAHADCSIDIMIISDHSENMISQIFNLI